MEQAYIPMDTIVEEDDGGEEAPEEEMYIPVLEEQSEEELSVKETVLGITRQMWLGNLSIFKQKLICFYTKITRSITELVIRYS